MTTLGVIYREQTPVEEVVVGGFPVFVKRDDLYGRPPAPPLGKLRGLRVVLQSLHEKNVLLVGCWDSRVSRLGEGLAAACHEFPRVRALVSYPTRIGVPLPGPIARAEMLGASILPLRGNHVSICYAQARSKVEALGGVMLPFGLECREAVLAVAKEAARIPPHLARGTIVLCCGSGATLAGLLVGLAQLPSRLIGVSSGRSITKIKSCIRRYVAEPPACIELVEARMPYDSIPNVACPFPAHPNYDLKAWQYLQENIENMKQPILFWNIGA